MWLWRNVGYGFLYNLFGMERQEIPSRVIEKGSEEGNFWYKLEIFDKYFKLEGKLQLPFVNKHLTTNVGWKSHDTFPRVMYANRLISVRTNKS